MTGGGSVCEWAVDGRVGNWKNWYGAGVVWREEGRGGRFEEMEVRSCVVVGEDRAERFVEGRLVVEGVRFDFGRWDVEEVDVRREDGVLPERIPSEKPES